MPLDDKFTASQGARESHCCCQQADTVSASDLALAVRVGRACASLHIQIWGSIAARGRNIHSRSASISVPPGSISAACSVHCSFLLLYLRLVDRSQEWQLVAACIWCAWLCRAEQLEGTWTGHDTGKD